MSTVDKALRVLELFSESQPNLGLSEIARQLGWDKSNVQRYVADLTKHGILERSARDKTYCLGPSLTRLSMVRDLTHPIAVETRRELANLSDLTGETAHSSVLLGDTIKVTGIVETKIRGTRVYIDPAEALPFHATASGLAILSALPTADVDRLVADPLSSFTSHTVVSADATRRLLRDVKNAGYAVSAGTFERDVVGVAAPVIGFDGHAVGAVAVATPTSRFGGEAEMRIANQVKATAKRVSDLHGARPRVD